MAYQLKEIERTTPTMVYTRQRITWGSLVHPEKVRAQVWLKHSVIPDYFTMLDVESILFGGAKPVRMKTPEAHIPTRRILAFHLLPPAEFIRDYDETEPYREMKPVIVHCDIFRFDGVVRLASIADLTASIRGFKEVFRPMYAVSISQPSTPSFKHISVPHALVRTEEIQYHIKE